MSRTQSSEVIAVTIHTLRISATKLLLESYSYYLKESELYKINDIKVHHTEDTISYLRDSCMKTRIFLPPSFFLYLSSS